MDVRGQTFYPLILDLLTDISEACFVAVDLELSGVPSKQPGQNSSKNDDGKPSLEERYQEVKASAERYQILQIGLTCVKEDVGGGKYILKPYNFDLNPLIDGRGLDIERIFCFQSGAVEFLLRNGFDLSRPFHHGVPYLTRAEADEAREKLLRRQDRNNINDIHVKPTETESLAFLERVRRLIQDWVDSSQPETPEYVNISAILVIDPNTGEEYMPDLSRLEKRLVHQLVRAEFSKLVTISKRGYIQIIRFDKQREDKIIAARKRELEERIVKQTGFRWIVEALRGGKVPDLDLRQCAADPVTGEQSGFVDIDGYRARFARARGKLRRDPRTLVGHNCFLDLIYLYHTFLGPLPDTVAEFQRKLHRAWPRIVDTKYMSTHNCGDINPVSSLEQIAQQLSHLQRPVLEIDAKHRKYAGQDALHEAGYDSFLTAQIAVRLSAKLNSEGTYIEVGGADQAREQPPQNGNPTTTTDADLVDKLGDVKLTKPTTPDTNSAPPGFTPSDPLASDHNWTRKGDPSLPPRDPNDLFTRRAAEQGTSHASGPAIEGGMPRDDSDFWRVYGNKLRVFGTSESVCVLGEEAAVGHEGEQRDEAGSE